MIVLEGADWQRVRRVSQKALNRMDLDAVVGACCEVMDLAAKNETFASGKDVDTYLFMSHLAFDAFHKVMYSFDPKMVLFQANNPHVKLLEACEGLLHGIRYRTFTKHLKFLWGLPTRKNIELKRNKDYVLEIGKRIAAERREVLKKETRGKDSKTASLLDGLLLSQDEEIMSDQEVLDQIGTFFFGAYETTANTLMFTLNSLAEAPDVQAKLRSELKKKFPNGRADIAHAKLADLDAVEYLLWTVDESFRLNSTASGIPRDATADVVVGGFKIKKGTSVSIDHRTASRDPFFFQGQKDLDKFNPERYAKYPMAEKILSIPFGFGSRICPGRRVAIAELKTFVSLIVSEYEILPPSDPTRSLVYDSKLGLTCADGTGFLRFRKL